MFDDVRDLYQDIILRHSREPRYMLSNPSDWSQSPHNSHF